LHGQAIGGVVQGLGGAFMENLVYDANGQLLTGNLADYLIPTVTDFPRIRAIAFENYPSPSNPLGVKGGGEGAIIPVGGLMANAVANALASFGAMPNELPLSPPRQSALRHPWESLRSPAYPRRIIIGRGSVGERWRRRDRDRNRYRRLGPHPGRALRDRWL
jgi:xanthine dehydrogenase molybdopterin-binding subunit B